MSDGDLSPRDVLARTISSSSYSILGQGVTTVTGVLRTILLARALAPEQFGLVALALFFVNLLGSISSFGLNQALIQREDEGPHAVATHFVLRMILALIGFGLMLAILPLLSVVYEDREGLAPAIIGLGIVYLVSAAASTPATLLSRRIHYQRIAALSVVSSVGTLIVAPTMAYNGYGIWSLIIGDSLLAALIRFAGLWFWRPPWRLSLQWSRSMAREYLTFGKYVLGSIQLSYMLDQFDDFWIGTSLGDMALGFYSKSYEFARYPRRIISRPLQVILYSAFARLQDKPQVLGRLFSEVSGLILRANGLLSVLLFLGAPELVPLLLGEQWIPMIVTFRLMLFYLLFDPLVAATGNLTTAIGKPQVLTRVKLAQLVLFVPLVLLLARSNGINGVAMAANGMLGIGLLLILRALRREIPFSLRELFGAPIIAATLSVGTVLTAESIFLEGYSLWTQLIAKISLAAAIYLLMLFILEGRKLLRSLSMIVKYRRGADEEAAEI